MAKARSTSARVSQPRSCAVVREHRQSVAAVEHELAPRSFEILFGEQHLWPARERHRPDEALPCASSTTRGAPSVRSSNRRDCPLASAQRLHDLLDRQRLAGRPMAFGRSMSIPRRSSFVV